MPRVSAVHAVGYVRGRYVPKYLGRDTLWRGWIVTFKEMLDYFSAADLAVL